MEDSRTHSRQISRHVYYFIKIEGGFVNGTVISTKFHLSPIPAGGLEILFLLKSSCYKQATIEKMKTFVQTLYDYNFVGTVTKDNSDKEDEMTIGMVSHSHPHGDQQLVGYTDTTGRVTEEDNSDEDEMEIAVSELQRPHSDRVLVSNSL